VESLISALDKSWIVRRATGASPVALYRFGHFEEEH
jgi:hypothetical protein